MLEESEAYARKLNPVTLVIETAYRYRNLSPNLNKFCDYIFSESVVMNPFSKFQLISYLEVAVAELALQNFPVTAVLFLEKGLIVEKHLIQRLLNLVKSVAQNRIR